uniref:Uncharacterized protein n=1 Tax=Panagrolaimus sp. JU765 TaxID=591449 RepID=A0AC34PUX7_9BILA
MANDDDFMNQIFATVTLPEVKYLEPEPEINSEKHVAQSISTSQTVVSSQHQVHTESVVVTHSHSEHHMSSEQHTLEHHESTNSIKHEHSSRQISESENSKHEDEMGSQVFHRPTVDTFKVENGVLESDNESANKQEDHSEESKQHDVLNGLPHKTEQHDSLIQELRKNQHYRSSSSSSSSSSSASTLKNEPMEHVVMEEHLMSHEESHHENALQELPSHHYESPPANPAYDMPPPEPARDYESDHDVVVPLARQTYHFDSDVVHESEKPVVAERIHSRTSSVASVKSQTSVSSKSSHPQPSVRSSRASSTSTLVSNKEVPIVLKRTSHEHEIQHHPEPIHFESLHSVHELANIYNHETNGIHKIREYGTGTNSHRSSISTPEYQPTNHVFETQHVIIESREKMQKPPQRNLNHTPRASGEIDAESIKPVNKLQEMFGGRASPVTYKPNTHELAKRDSVSSVDSKASKSNVSSRSMFFS